jgi:hypothetical protein
MFAEVMFNFFALRKWKANPRATKRKIGLRLSWKTNTAENRLPLSVKEVRRMKQFLRKHAPSMYQRLFLE